MIIEKNKNTKKINLLLNTNDFLYDELYRMSFILGYKKVTTFIITILEEWTNEHREEINNILLDKIMSPDDLDKEEEIEESRKTIYKYIYKKQGKFEVFYKGHYIGRYKTIEEAIEAQERYKQEKNDF